MSEQEPPDETQVPAEPPAAPPAEQTAAPPAVQPGGPVGNTRSVGLSILWAIITLWIYTYIWVFKTHNEMKEHTGNGVGGWLGFIIYLVFPPITWFLVPAEIKSMHERDGRTSPVGPWRGLWVLFPILGPFFWFIPVQGALNDYWMSKGAPAP
jgi:hypothetical protein